MNTHIVYSPTLVELNESTASVTVFCVHPSGGGLKPYERLAKKLEDSAKVYGLEDPCIYADEKFSSVTELAHLHVRTIRAVQPTGPYVLFGSCSAGPVAYEIAYRLHLEGEPVARVVMFGSHELVGFDPAVKERYFFLRDYLGQRFGLDLRSFDWAALEAMEIEPACAALATGLRATGVIPRTMDIAWIQKSLESLCRARAATKAYMAPGSSLAVDLFRQPRNAETAAHGQRDWCDWARLTTGQLNVIEHAAHLGVNDDILAEPYVNTVVAELKRISLKEVRGSEAAA
jgi:thioesterase domain-containing protein